MKRYSTHRASKGKTIQTQNIKVGKKNVEAVSAVLLAKTFILLRGSKGYIMCGYLNLKAADQFKDVAAKIVGVTSIEDALKAKVHSVSRAAKQLGLYRGQSVKNVLKVIA
ncbi:MAG: YunC family protein [Nitrospinota bacterium]